MLRGHRSRVVLAALLSVGAVVGQILITLLVGDAADQIDDGDRGELVRSGAGAEDGVVQMRRGHRCRASTSSLIRAAPNPQCP